MNESSTATRTGTTRAANDTIADLHRLVEALDRRLPRFDRVGEAEIARDATELRRKALALIARLARPTPESA